MQIITKEILIKENIIKDLLRSEKFRRNIREEIHFCYYAPCITIAVFILLLWRFWLIALPFLVVAAYHVIRLIAELREFRSRKSAIENGDFAIAQDTLSHIANTSVHEPHMRGGRRRNLKEVADLYFGGGSWRIYANTNAPNRNNHYLWSKDFAMTNAGLLNTSVKGNEFYIVIFEGEVVYAYNKKLFEYTETN